MVATESRPDIYELLGISPGASSALAREMYWSKISEYLEAERRGEEGARDAIDALNEALNIILDGSLRREYDSALKSTKDAPARPQPLAPSRARVWSVLVGLEVLTAAAAVAVAVLISPFSGVGVAFIGTATAFGAWIGFQRVRPLAGSPFALLGLDNQASLDEVELAYETRVQELLVQVHRNPAVVSDLELVDRAYVRACALIAVGEVVSTPDTPVKRREPSRTSRAAGWLLGGIGRLLGRALSALFDRVGQAMLWVAGRTVDATRRGVARLAGWVGDRAAPHQPTPVHPDSEEMAYDDDLDDTPAPSVDMNRRLAAGFKHAAERIAETDARATSTGSTGAAAPVAEPITSYIVLGSFAGERRVGIGDSPIKIGSAQSCDLVLPEDSGVSPEHALIWRHQDAIVLHVTDHSAACLVNDRPMTWATLESGDEVRMGTFRMRIEVVGADSQE